jgi:hypothetical protein
MVMLHHTCCIIKYVECAYLIFQSPTGGAIAARDSHHNINKLELVPLHFVLRRYLAFAGLSGKTNVCVCVRARACACVCVCVMIS